VALAQNSLPSGGKTEVMISRVTIALGLLAGSALSSCGSGDESKVGTRFTSPPSVEVTSSSTTSPNTLSPTEQTFPDVVDASAMLDGDTWTFVVTISSPYDTPERYADAWRVLGPDGSELDVRELGHDHATEQPFTRSLTGVDIPDGVDTVTIEGRDRANGYGGTTLDVDLTREAAQ
jgi:hypothetical protein